MTVSAAVRFRPEPPALSEMRKTRRPVLALEVVDPLLAVLGAPVEVLVGDAVLVHRPLDDREHRDELAEDEDAVPAFDARLDELAQRHELPRVFVAELAREPEEPRIARRLTEAREPREDLDVAPREPLPLDLAHDLRAHLLEDRAVEPGLLAGELAEVVGLDLLGQVLGDLGLGAPEDERVDRRAQASRGLLVPGVDGARVALLELVERPEEARVRRSRRSTRSRRGDSRSACR